MSYSESLGAPMNDRKAGVSSYKTRLAGPTASEAPVGPPAASRSEFAGAHQLSCPFIGL